MYGVCLILFLVMKVLGVHHFSPEHLLQLLD